MDREAGRDTMNDSAYEWALVNLFQFRDAFSRTQSDPSATMEYHGMVDGIVWSDELPKVAGPEGETLQKVFCVLIHLRTSIILGEEVSPSGMKLIGQLRHLAPSWCFIDPDRWSATRRKDYENVRSKFFKRLDRLCAIGRGSKRGRKRGEDA